MNLSFSFQKTFIFLKGALIASTAFASSEVTVSLIGRAAPDIEKLPPGMYRDLAIYGRDLVNQTHAHIGPEVADPSMRYAGNNLSCSSCHRSGGTIPFAMPFIGTAAGFPQYRPRENALSTLQDRVNGCMERSMNGRPLPLNSREMMAIVTYITAVSQGIPMGAKLEGNGVQMIRMPNRRANPEAGKVVYEKQCASCHGSNGEGVRVGQPGDGKGYTFPPLWGPDSFNTGAGMNRLAMATRFVLANMPLGATHEKPMLTLDEAYDVAAYMLSHPRPEKANLELDFPLRWTKPVDAAFPPYVLGTPDQHKYGPFPPLLEKQRQLAAEMQKNGVAGSGNKLQPTTR